MTKAFVSWSGGKDCCLATYHAKLRGLKVACLLTMVTEDKSRSCSHGINAQWMRVQAEAIGIPLLQYSTTGENYEAVFKTALRELQYDGVTTGVFGHIDFEPHREWIDNVCKPCDITPLLPLWGGNQNDIVKYFIEAGFTAKVVAVRADLLGAEWLGRTVDKAFIHDITSLGKEITPCGEAGEFHTLVVDGLIFKKRLEISAAAAERRGDHWF